MSNETLTSRILESSDATEKNMERINRMLEIVRTAHRPMSREDLLTDLNTPGLYYIGVFDGNRIVGMATLSVVPRAAGGLLVLELNDVARLPNMKGRGVGDALMQCVITTAQRIVRKKKMPAKITLTSNPSRVAAQRLYQKYGFRPRNTVVFQCRVE
jgi:ribosomal protein S18 acetylase RimI-like enzyme